MPLYSMMPPPYLWVDILQHGASSRFSDRNILLYIKKSLFLLLDIPRVGACDVLLVLVKDKEAN